MAIVLMLSWWYSKGWIWIIQATQQRLHTVSQVFAVSMLLKTLFSPWKQIYSESTFTTFFRNLVDNTVSRCIGAIVRGAILLWALLLSVAIFLIGVTSFVLWPIVPLLVIILPVLAAIGVAI